MISRGICFDMDGTLIDSGPGSLRQIFKVARLLNLSVTPEIEQRLRTIWGQRASDLIKAAWPNIDIDRFCKQWEDLDIAEPWPTFPGTKKALKKLFEKFPLSILTNRNFRTTISQLEYNDLLQFFGLVITADSSPYKKPDPQSIESILEKYRGVGVNPKQVIFVGDTVEGDWKLAQAVGIEFFAVLSGGMDSKEKFLAVGVPEDHIFDSVAHLTPVLLRK